MCVGMHVCCDALVELVVSFWETVLPSTMRILAIRLNMVRLEV